MSFRLCVVSCSIRLNSVTTTGTESSVTEKTDGPNAVTRIQRTPLRLIEEITVPERVYTDVELIMMAWSEEQAEYFRKVTIIVRTSLFLMVSIIMYGVYTAVVGSDNFVRGNDNIPPDMKIGSVVYLDVSENGIGLGRLVIGLLNDRCPLYCEAFHRRCTGSGGKGGSWRGLKMSAIIPHHVCIFGSGRDMTHEVPGFNEHYLPTEFVSEGAFRGALTSIPYKLNEESPNFNIHYTSGQYKPQVFGIVIGGFDIIERINSVGSKHGNSPKREIVVTDCGELCTLDKSHILPIPWKVYESITNGYDYIRFGPKAAVQDLLQSVVASAPVKTPVAQSPSDSKRAWWRLGLF